MTEEQEAEYRVLRMATSEGKFAVELGVPLRAAQQLALERMQIRHWITLIDLTPLAGHPDRLFRIFLASDKAMAWLRRVG